MEDKIEVKDFPKILVQMFKNKEASPYEEITFPKNVDVWNCAWMEKGNRHCFMIGVETIKPDKEYASSIDILIEEFNKQDLSVEEVLGNIQKAFKEYIHG